MTRLLARLLAAWRAWRNRRRNGSNDPDGPEDYPEGHAW